MIIVDFPAPIADIVSSLSLGLVVWYGGMNIIAQNGSTTFGDLFSYTMFIGMLYNPLRQIADKFNERSYDGANHISQKTVGSNGKN